MRFCQTAARFRSERTLGAEELGFDRRDDREHRVRVKENPQREATPNCSAQNDRMYVEEVSGIESIKVFGAEQQRVDEGESRLVRIKQAGFRL